MTQESIRSSDPSTAPLTAPLADPLSWQDLVPIPEEKLIFRLPTEFSDPAVERRHRKERLAGALRIFGRFGFEEGVAGHITARDPEFPDHFWVNPFGVSFKQVRVSDLLLVNHSGDVVQGRHRVNRAAFAIHAAVHAARPDAIGAAHSHSVYGKALSATGQQLEPLTQDACAFYEDHGCYEDYSGVANDPEEGRRIAEALGGYKAVILRNHGLLTAAGSVDAAAYWFITMERSAQAQLAAKAAGPTIQIPHEEAKFTYGQVGFDLAGWFQFQPLFDQISRTDPDLFE
ncbi:class II aldolase/adducin family protein [Streptomyces aurantiacus]|uniref:class II aldolase/adducin family protein n=1 Tax=Streptomyces aurantiacus TaxID=47760 RepID=UPI00099EDD49|nr:class II aldolase/adducin family protein [Streptomyces aurantiacus]